MLIDRMQGAVFDRKIAASWSWVGLPVALAARFAHVDTDSAGRAARSRSALRVELGELQWSGRSV